MKLFRIAMVLLPVVTGSVPVFAAGDQDIDSRVRQAAELSGGFLKELGGTMKKALKSGGPDAAMSVCRDKAPEIANRKSLSTGWKVTRVGTRVRNPLLGSPDAWEQKVLQEFMQRAAQGESYKTMSYSAVVEEPAGRYVRYMKAIGTAPKCLLCHGESAQIPSMVKSRLEELYPHDQATGYKAGDLRGAVSIKQPLDE